MATRADVAKLAGVAESTVSYVLSGTRPIGAPTRERVLAAMATLGYVPNALAKGLASRRSGLIALLIPLSERGLHATEIDYVRAVTERSGAAGFHVVLNTMDADDLDGLRAVLSQGLFEGAILMEARTGDARIEVLQASGVPFAVIGQTGDDVPFVDTDFAASGPLAIGHLAGLGHRVVAMLSQPKALLQAHYGPVERAERALIEAAALGGVEFATFHVGQSLRAGHAALEQIVAELPGVTAVVSINEPATIGLIMAAGERGLRVPDQLSVLALGISSLSAESVVPALTTVAAPPAVLSHTAVDMLVEIMQEPSAGADHVLVSMELTPRASTARCPAA